MRLKKTVLCAWLATLSPSLTSAQAPATLDAVLALPPSSGADALLMLHTSDPRVPQRWRTALADADAGRRATAARLIGAAAARTAIGGLRAAAVTEKDPVALGEMLRALVVIGSDASDGVVYERVADIPPLAASRLAVALASLRPAGIVAHLLSGGTLADRSDVVADVHARLLAVSPQDAERLEQGAPTAGPRVLGGVLRVAAASRRRVPPTLVVAALRANTHSAVDALRYVVDTYEKPSEAAADVTLVDAYRASRAAATVVDPVHTFLLALADRWLTGASASLVPAIKALDPVETDRLELGNSVLAALTKDELRALESRLGASRDPRAAALRASLEEGVARNRWRQPVTEPVLVLSDVPSALVRGLVTLTGCKGSSDDAFGLYITHRPDGRVQSASLGGANLSPACLQLAQVLIASSYGPPALPGSAQARTLVRLDEPWWSCVASTDAARPATAIANRRLPPPKKTFDRKPAYPTEAQDKRVQGVVIMEATITPAGCMSDVRVVRSIPPLDLHALLAVSHWRYEPYTVDGQAIPVNMTVTVNFQLQ